MRSRRRDPIPAAGRQRRRGHPWLVVSVLALLGVMLLGVFPVRAYVDQQHQRQELAAEVATLVDGNQRLSDRVANLQAEGTIERLARERYNMVRPGEEAYSILPEAREPPPEAAPAPPPPAPEGNWLSRLWAKVTSHV